MLDPPDVREARRALGRQLAQSRKAAGLTQEQLAAKIRYGRSSVGNAETALQANPQAFWASCDTALHANGALVAHYQQVVAMQRAHLREAANIAQLSALLVDSDATLDEAPPSDGAAIAGGVERRTVLGVASGATLAAVLGFIGPTPSEPRGRLVQSIIGRRRDTRSAPIDIEALAAQVACAKRRYQACRYAELLAELPTLLDTITTASQNLPQRGATSLLRLAADAFQVAGSLLLKLGDVSMAMLAADRSLTAAERSGDPLSAAASARLVTHALMSAGHPAQGSEYAADVFARLDPTTHQTAAADAVFGALMLRAAIAAARAGDRSSTGNWLDQADERAGCHSDADRNLRWTAFSGVNVTLHRVNAALTLGDAGQALEHARHVDLSQVQLPERRATLMIDVATAYHQWGKPERAFHALRAAEDTAPEEVRVKPAVHTIVEDLRHRAPISLRPHVAAMAQRLGAS